MSRASARGAWAAPSGCTVGMEGLLEEVAFELRPEGGRSQPPVDVGSAKALGQQCAPLGPRAQGGQCSGWSAVSPKAGGQM